jgi:hypothetical protein
VQWRPPSKKKKGGKNLSPRDRKACHSVSTAFLIASTQKVLWDLTAFSSEIMHAT